MQDNLRVGTKVMTIGRLIGVITKVYSDGTIELDVGVAGSPVIITVNREAIAVNLTAQAQAAAQKAANAQPKAETEQKAEEAEGEKVEEVAETEEKVEEKKEDDAI